LEADEGGTALTRFGKRKIAVIAASVAVLGGIGAGAAVAAGGGGDDATDTPITGSALAQAEAAALAHTGGGRVTGSEVGDEEGYYEVEVTEDDGSKFDVHLDRSFKVIDASPDGSADENANEPDGGQ
jgi:uncharacterized membrane protein YkoI